MNFPTLHGGDQINLFFQWSERYGCRVVYPYGIFSTGLIVRDPNVDRDFSALFGRYVLYCGIAASVGIASKSVWALPLGPAIFLWYVLTVRKLAAKCEIAEERITKQDVLLRMAQQARLTWWGVYRRIIGLSLGFLVGFGMLYLAWTEGGDTVAWGLGFFCSILCIFVSTDLVRLLRIMRRIRTGPWAINNSPSMSNVATTGSNGSRKNKRP